MTDTPFRNGVDTETLFATINVVKDQPDLAHFTFRATNTWVSGAHSRGRITGYYGAGQEQTRPTSWELDADHPVLLTGTDEGPAPVEYVLLGLAGCLTAGLANIAAARRVTLRRVESSIEGTMDLRGILGLSADVRNGYDHIQVTFRIDADASPEKIAELVEQSRARSAVFDIVTNGVPVDIEVVTV